MLRIAKRFLSKFIMCVCAIAVFATPVYAESNVPSGDIGEYGTWVTENNQKNFISTTKQDIASFYNNPNVQLVDDYVPIEAKVGMAFIMGLSKIAQVLDNSLVRFTIIFLIMAYAFWIAFEGYQIIVSGKGARDKIESIIRKGFVLAVWLIILNFGAAQVFMWIMGPVISIGTYLSDLILNTVVSVSGISLPDTCGAIHNYVASHANMPLMLDTNTTADILCVPTRLSGFFYTAVAAGWKWTVAGIGRSMFTFVVGIIFICLFIYNGFRFAFIAFGVIADLFLTLMMLPFTAIVETLGKTSYKGIAGDIFNQFIGLFKAESLQNQILHFIRAAIYFVSLSIVIALCAALLSVTMNTNLAAQIPSLENTDFMTILLTGCLVAYLAGRADKIASDIGGGITADFGNTFRQDAQKLWNNTTKTAREWWKIIRNEKKS